MYYNRKKEIIKNVVLTSLILLLALVSTNFIYFKYKDERNVDYNSESLDIVFHEKTGAHITIDKVTPVTDSVGLSSKAYTFSVKNNLTEPVNYRIVLSDDIEKIIEDKCEEYQIGKDFIKVSVKEEGKENKIYTLSELEEGLLLDTKIKALEQNDYSVRFWIDKDITIPNGSNLHYHGMIKIKEYKKV